MRILVVDDDPKLRGFVRSGLLESGMECELAADAETAAGILRGPRPFDVVLLDVMMPGRSGWDFLADLRAAGDETPVLFLSARGQVDERIRGLTLGADDYIVKPFEFRELLARIAAVARRRQAIPMLASGELRMDLGRRLVELAGRRIETSAREFDLLRTLVEADGAVLSRAELLHRIWAMEFDPGTNVVEVLVARLRQKLGKQGRASIETVPGAGYRFHRSTPS
jgi:two-component system copper resistance phosphate regulon response regulator CusR